MDESRPGHPTRLPLIIDRPDLAHPVRRVVGVALTLLCWGIWLGMWFVLLTTLGYHVGFELPRFLVPQVVSLESFRALAHLVPYALATASAVLFAAYIYERLKRHWGKTDERWHPVGMDRLARDAALDPENLARWQRTQVLYVEHGPRGRVMNAYNEPPRQA
ncbi:MAG: poly-beta-1,6-N-acetyl-D-glucosamine biosynthesis protein PgaD [Betaproteobacteria bacterium]|nr:poly-beta-1,6-N-acetyl-D-glucosamine biosynthesis protein PgaD [Betaproteobacteria bacterium]